MSANSILAMSSTVYCCPTCRHCSKSIKDFLKHLRLYHADSPAFKIDCGLDGCCRTFSNFYTFRNHVYVHHSLKCRPEEEQVQLPTDLNGSESSPDSDGDDNLDAGDNSEADDDSNCDGNPSDDVDPDFDDKSHFSAIQRAAALWILKVRETHRLPQSVIELIIKDVQTLYEVSLL